MEIIQRPHRVLLSPRRRTSILEFSNGKSAECYMRGAVCWPVPLPHRNNEIVGFALIAGYDVSSGTITIYEEREFVCIDHVAGKDGMIQFEGLSSFFNLAWNRYFCSTFFWRQPETMKKKYQRQVRKSLMIKPKPQFTQLYWDQQSQPEQILFEKLTLNKLFARKEDNLFKEVQKHEVVAVPSGSHAIVSPEMHALHCLLMGYDRYSWREPEPEPSAKPEIIYVR